MIQNIRVSIVYLLLSINIDAYGATCVPQIAATKAQLITSSTLSTELIKEMKKLDKELDRSIANLDAMIESAVLENAALNRVMHEVQSSAISLQYIVSSQNVSVRARILYLRSSNVRLKFYLSEENSNAIKEIE